MQPEPMIVAGAALAVGQPGGRLVDWVRRRPLVLFFAGAFLFSWVIYAGLAAFPAANRTTYNRITLIAAYGPAVSAAVLAWITGTRPRRKLPAGWWALGLAAFGLAAGVEWLDHLWWGHRVDASLLLADGVLVLLATVTLARVLLPHVATAAPQPRPGRTVPAWQTVGWAVVALGLWPLLVLASNAIARLLGLGVPAAPTWPDVPLPLILLESLAWCFLFAGPLNEEPGWRGFALPRLQNRYSPLVASIILGALWGLWHLPLHLMGVYYGGALGAVIRIQEIPRAILFTWLYNRTRGSLLVMILFHAAINTTSLFLARSAPVAFVLCTLLAVVVVFSDRMDKRRAQD